MVGIKNMAKVLDEAEIQVEINRFPVICSCRMIDDDENESRKKDVVTHLGGIVVVVASA